MSLTQRFTMVALVALVVAGCSGCFVQAPIPDTFVPAPVPAVDDVHQQADVVFGDSLTENARKSAGLIWRTQHPERPLSWNSYGATQIFQWMDRMAYLPTWLAAQGVAPADTVVTVALATNNLTLGTGAEAEWQTLAALNQLRDDGVGCVSWLTLNTTSAAHREPEIRAETAHYNAFLRQLVANRTYGDLLVLQEWDLISAGHESYLNGTRVRPADWVHYTDPAGNDAYAATLAGASALCPQRAVVAP